MITAVVMVGEPDESNSPRSWVQGARRTAARDLLDQLARQPLIQQIALVSPEVEDLSTAVVTHTIRTQPGPIHVGRQLAEISATLNTERILYFGGGAAPLLEDATLSGVVEQLATGERIILTNNRFATDWAGIVPATIVADWTERLPQDNMLGWVLSAEAGLTVQAQAASAASRLDIDTPTDLLALRLHARTKPHLREYLARLPLNTGRLQEALAVLATPASRVFIAGRFGPDVWSALNRATQCWLRVISEERGMVSSGRQSRGEVYSLLADHLTAVGLDRFLANLAAEADAAFIDTRVLMAHYGRWPAEPSRFASDLGLVDQIEEAWLRDFTVQTVEAPLPIILGGHGLMSGDMFAFCEML